MTEYIFGRNAVFEALEMHMPVVGVFLTPTIKDFTKLSEKMTQLAPGIKIEPLSRRKMEAAANGIRTGGICAVLQDTKPITSIPSLIGNLKNTGASSLLIALDEIQDPRNFGAIIRTAFGAGFQGVVYQKRRQAGITGIVAAASTGACFKIPLCEVVNLSRALNQLKSSGFWIYGTDAAANVSLYNVSFNLPMVIVIGSEGRGMRRIIRKACDEIITIPLHAGLNSLNASVAAGIVLFEAVRQLKVQ